MFQSPRITGAETSFFQEEIPGFFFFIGGRPESISPTSAIPNHSPYFSIDERALSPAVHAMSRIALDFYPRVVRSDSAAPCSSLQAPAFLVVSE